ncbi:MAG: hypothetical protein Q8R08_01310 [bacterium]|nr:hypothetical protein [bacterium]
MRILCADEFSKQLDKLPDEAQRHYRKQEQIFLRNWKDPRLHIKKLTGHALAFSFRITRRYRVIFNFVAEETALFLTIGHRKDIYR